MGNRKGSRLERVARARAGLVSRWAALRLCRRMERRARAGYSEKDHLTSGRNLRSTAASVLAVACAARDPWAAARARRAVETSGANPFVLRDLLAAVKRAALIPDSQFEPWGSRYDPHPVAASLLLAPVPECPHVPPVRLVRHLTRDELPLPGPSGVSRRELADWTVAAALGATDDRARAALADLLTRTDEPHLLEALTRAFIKGISDAEPDQLRRHGEEGPRPYRLWRGQEPTLLTEIIQGNRHLPSLPAPPAEGPPRYGSAPGVLLVVLKGRIDLLSHVIACNGAEGTVRSLLQGVSLPAPDDFTERCRSALRALPPGAAREHVCEQAVLGNAEARAAAIEARYLPADELRIAPFLFATEQWERYEEYDPDGELLNLFCTEPYRMGELVSEMEQWMDWKYRGAVTAAAHGSGRPDPCPPPEWLTRRKGRNRDGTSRGQQAGIGGWPTDGGGGGHGAGDHGGGGYAGGGFGGGF